MPISFSRYIDITSGVGGNAAVKSKDLITRIFTTNNVLPPQSFAEFESAEEVGTYFGFSSEEYLRSEAYFGFVSKAITSPDKISFSRWVASPSAPFAQSDPNLLLPLASLDTITAGPMNLTISGVVANLTLSFTGAGNYAAIATIIQTALDAVAGLAGTTCVFNASSGTFLITGPTTGAAAGTITFSTNISFGLNKNLGFLGPNAVIGAGSDVETITQTLTNSVGASTNFATFLFTTAANLTLLEAEQVGQWLATQSVQYAFEVPVLASEAAAWGAALLPYEGVFVTLAPIATEYPEMIPGKIAASTVYSNRNVSQNYMFQQDPSVTPSVQDDTDANTYDALRINYMGLTQENGQTIAFYQTGVAMGGSTAPTDMNVYVNEIWFRADIQDNIMTLLLSVPQVPTNNKGRAMLFGVIQASVDAALFNGVISVGETFTQTQIQYIQNIVGDTGQAAAQVQTTGYWINITFSSSVNSNGAVVWQANYTIIYAKDNAIRKVVGSHILI